MYIFINNSLEQFEILMTWSLQAQVLSHHKPFSSRFSHRVQISLVFGRQQRRVLYGDTLGLPASYARLLLSTITLWLQGDQFGTLLRSLCVLKLETRELWFSKYCIYIHDPCVWRQHNTMWVLFLCETSVSFSTRKLDYEALGDLGEAGFKAEALSTVLNALLSASNGVCQLYRKVSVTTRVGRCL